MEKQQEIIPRRNRLDLFSPAELAIYKTVEEVEKTGADVRLTNAIIKLHEARALVADYVDEKPSESEPIGQMDEEWVWMIESILRENWVSEIGNHKAALQLKELFDKFLPSSRSQENDVIDTLSKQSIISRLKKIGFTRMDEPNHYANECGLSFVFNQVDKYSLANGHGDILISSNDIFEVLDCIVKSKENDVNVELLEALKMSMQMNESISNSCGVITSENYIHEINIIKGKSNRIAEYIQKHYGEDISNAEKQIKV